MTETLTPLTAAPAAAPAASAAPPLRLAVVGAGPAGLALALLAAERLPAARITLFDARPLQADVSGDPRTIALSLGSVHLLRRLGAYPADAARPITEVHVSQHGALLQLGTPEVRIRAADEGCEMLGAVLAHGRIVAALQQAWLARAAAAPERLHTRFGTPVTALKPFVDAIEVDAGIADRFDLAVIAEGGVFDPRSPAPLERRAPLRHDYRQTAWVGQVTLEGAEPGVAFERFTRAGPVAVLPLAAADEAGRTRAALVWCVKSADDPVAPLDDRQRLALLATLLHPAAGRPLAITPLKSFPLGLTAERALVDGRSVRIGNAAQTLHPVAGQGLNLGLRDAYELVEALARGAGIDAALRRLERRRAPDRLAMIATTDFLARSFTWDLPGLTAARGLGLAALQALGPLKSAFARQMMFGRR